MKRFSALYPEVFVLQVENKASCTIEAPCKINLHLNVGEKRSDGFHNLESIYASLALSDTLYFEPAGNEGDFDLDLTWHCPGETIQKENNLVFRAVSLFREKTGFTAGLKARLDKRVPTGAGLGGGSSDAASSLMALNSLAGGLLPAEQIREMAAQLGSDVPFFLSGGTAFVSGRGELIEPVLPLNDLWVVLVKPPFSSSTALSYKLLDEARQNSLSRGKNCRPKLDLFAALEKDPGTWPYFNDFLPVFLNEGQADNSANATEYKTILTGLQASGASYAGLSGTGSCCFGVFKTREAAEDARNEFDRQEYFSCVTFFLARKADPVLK